MNALSELAINYIGSIGERMTSDNPQRTVCFKMPVNEHYHISMTVRVSGDFICDWIGYDLKYQMFHSLHVEGSYVSFDYLTSIPVVYLSIGNQDISTVDKENNISFNAVDQNAE